MSLKLLVLPLFIILEVVIVIGYIKPDVSAIFAKRDEIATVEVELANVDAVNRNIQSLSASLASRSEAASFVGRYYPKVLDEERVVDMFNFLAQQTGIIVSGVKFTRNVKTHSVNQESYNQAISNGMTPEQATDIAAAAALAIPEDYIAEVSVIGAYANIKDFYTRLYHADRLYEAIEFSMGRRKLEDQKVKEGEVSGVQPNFLSGTFIAKFPYLGAQRVNDPMTDPIFQTSAIDFEPLDTTLAFVSNPLSPLESGTGGRPNPFE